MGNHISSPLVQFLIKIVSTPSEKLEIPAGYDWVVLSRLARRANLLSRIASFIHDRIGFDAILQSPRNHLQSALLLAEANARSARWEVFKLHEVLSQNQIDFILLKGGAYIWKGNQASKGRLFSDIDIMVHKSDIEKAERTLIYSGWMADNLLDRYDQRYYRKWMHEVPPLTHLGRKTSLDLHHSIIPPVSNREFCAERLWDVAVEDERLQGLYTLSPIDMIIHSATHLFHEGEFEQGLRDLSDLDLLIREYIVEESLWDELLQRARVLNLQVPIYYALNFTYRVLQTPIPEIMIQKAAKRGRLRGFHNWMMNQLYLRALMPKHVTFSVRGQETARFLLFIRSHWIKMPWYLLFPHLIRKGWLSLLGKKGN